jgi:uncharacterized protein YdiU (UPF0061 family)
VSTPRRLPRAALGAALLLLSLALPTWAQPEPALPAGTLSAGTPPIVETLGADRFVKLTGVLEPGKVVWFNWKLAGELGLELPRGNVMTPAFEAELARHLGWRLLKEGEAANGRPTVDMYADRYGGWGMGHNKGAGRAAFFGRFNLNTKGVGVTPLVSGATHYSHRHGGAPLKEGILEAVWGEVGTNLFEAGSTRILAVVDTGDHTVWEDGGKERRALIVRAGHQLRPAHLLAEGFTPAADLQALVRMLDATGTLVRVRQDGREVLDLSASLGKVAERHARTAAELFRWRILHGGLSPGNKSFDGGMLDLGTVTSQPRTAPVHVLDYTDGSGGVRADLKFETENEWRVRDLERYLEVAKQARGKPGYLVPQLDVAKVYREAYRRALEVQLLEATGLKREAAEALRRNEPDLVRRYVDTLKRLGAMTNDVPMNIERDAVARGSVVDIFGALPGLAKEHVGRDGKTPTERVVELLAVDAMGPDAAAKTNQVKTEAALLAGLHRSVVEAGFTSGGASYDDRAEFERSLVDRATFEDRGLELLNRKRLADRLTGLIDAYGTSGDPSALRNEVDALVGESLRDVDALMEGRASAVLPDGSLLANVETRGGLTYSVRAAADGTRTLRVELPLSPAPGGYTLPTGGGGHLSDSQAREVDYRFTTDAWTSHKDVRGALGTGLDGGPALIFEAPVAKGSIGQVEGLFHVLQGDWWIKSGPSSPEGREAKNFGGYRYAVPGEKDLARLEARRAHGEGAGFAPRRLGLAGELLPPGMDRAEVERVFAAVRDAALVRGRTRLGELAEVDRAASEARLGRLGATTLTIESTNDVDARFVDAENLVRLTTGALAAIDARSADLPEASRAAFRRRALSLVLAHELAHALGITSERAADAEAVRVLRAGGSTISEADARKVLEAFGGGGGSLLERLRDLARYGSLSGRRGALDRALRGEVDGLARWRRADGTLDWKRLGRDKGLAEVGGLAHFALALFLKELAVVAKTGDRGRIEEFFDGLLTTDFYKEYGLFVLGARAGEVAYSRYLERFVKPRFVNGVLKTNIILATGMALPRIVDGTFSGKAFAISLGSLGLSSAAVKAGAASIKWLVDLRTARATGGTLAAVGEATRLAKVGGWFYTAVELAVVLYLADEIDHRVNAALELSAAREALGDANRALLRVTADPAATPDAVKAALEANREAWTAWRDHLYAPLARDEAEYAARMGTIARRAKLLDDERVAALNRLREQPALAANLVARYGSIEGYAAARQRDDEAAVARDVEAATAAYTAAREAHLREVYEANRRNGGYLDGVDSLPWLAGGATAGGAGDPWSGRGDVFAGWGRSRAVAAFDDRLEAASLNRLQSYDDEAAFLSAALSGVPARADRAAVASHMTDARALALRTRDADDRLVHGTSPVVDAGTSPTPGLRGAIVGATGR